MYGSHIFVLRMMVERKRKTSIHYKRVSKQEKKVKLTRNCVMSEERIG